MSNTPFNNCKFRDCDLPGQCIAEGKCHHPMQERSCAKCNDDCHELKLTAERDLAAANERINLATEIMKKCTPTDDWNLPLERLCEIVQEGYWKLDAETAELEIKLTAANERLENNHYYDAQGVRHECEPGEFPDGIACRDETIKLLEKRIKELETKLACARAETVEQCAIVAQNWQNTDQMERGVAYYIRALASAPPGFVCVKVEWLEEARDEITDWASYAGEYFQDKHGLSDDIKKWDSRIAAARGDK